MSDSFNVHSSSDQVPVAGHSESEVETGVVAFLFETSVADLDLEMDGTPLEYETNEAGLELKIEPDALHLEMETDVPQETSKQERYSAD
jgi:hypothetical protein